MSLKDDIKEKLGDVTVKTEDVDVRGRPSIRVEIGSGSRSYVFTFAKDLKLNSKQIAWIVRSYLR